MIQRIGSSRFARRLPALLLGLVLAGCGGSGGSGSSAIGDCAIPNQNQYVYDVMRQWYLWYNQLPTLNPATLNSPEATLQALIAPVRNPVDRFSYITTQAEEDALFGASQFVGFGYRQQIGAQSVTVVDVFEGGPADQGGLDRGSRLQAINGVPIADVLASEGGLAAALGPPEVGFQVTMTFLNRAGEQRTSTFTKDVVTIPPVTGAQVFELDGRQTGYLVLRNFVDPGVPAMDAAFNQFRAAGVTQVIIDLRYNGGGLLRTLQHLANLLGSRIVGGSGAVFATLQYNDKNTGRNETLPFASQPLDNALDLQRLVVITTPATASASEMLINGMDPWVETVTVGSVTFGKPVGQLGFRFCEKVLRPISFQTVNALGEGDYFDGIAPTCPAADDPSFAFGVAGEASFDAALHWLRFGVCPPSVGLEERILALPIERERPRYRPNDAL
jgi:carboxyl-terminal processing protease